jgi:hypothetical protein
MKSGLASALPVLLGLCFAPRPALADDAACIAGAEQSLASRKEGKLHEALRQLATCAAAGCPAEVKAECARRIAEVDAAMPTLILAAKDGAGNDLHDVKVSMDGAPLLATLDGRPVAIDPGAHTFRFELAGQAPVEKNLVLLEGDKDRRESVVIGPVVAHPPEQPPATPPPSPGWSTGRVVGLIVGGAGVVGLGVGAIFGAFALSSQNREKSDCPDPSCSPLGRKQASADYDTAKSDATGSTIAFVAGGALVAAGAVLWLTAPRSEGAPEPTPRLGLAPALRGSGVRLVGEF